MYIYESNTSLNQNKTIQEEANVIEQLTKQNRKQLLHQSKFKKKTQNYTPEQTLIYVEGLDQENQQGITWVGFEKESKKIRQ